MEDRRLLCSQMVPLVTSEGCNIYQLKNETGEGIITQYEVFPGVTVAYNDFHMQYFDSEFVPARHLFCIDHCREGRLEYISSKNAYSYVEDGDVKLDRRLTHTGHFEFPLSHYHGIMISFDMETACARLASEIKDFPVDLKMLQRKYCVDIYPAVIHGSDTLEHIFKELYAVPEEVKRPYFKIKILELLLCLKVLKLPDTPKEKPYFYKTQVEKIKAVKEFLVDHADRNFTQDELADRFDIPLTSMKTCFKSVYGTSIGNWLLKYRMNNAAVFLRQKKSLTVTELAGRLGYDSPSKFAMAFRKVMGMSPVEYRNSFVFLTKKDQTDRME